MGRLFGTDGIRGIANSELTCDRALAVGRAAAAVLAQGLKRKPVFLIGCDTRISSSMLVSAVAAGICSAGADILLLGVVPTPAVAYLVKRYRADAGIMISASHNPFAYNGIKIFGGEGYKLPDELEERIESLVLDGTASDLPTGDRLGSISSASHAKEDYIAHVGASTDLRLDGMRIAIDCANGSASTTAEALFSSLGAEIHILHSTPNGININEDCGSTHMESLTEYVIANHLDCGLAFDGDADRLLCVDETGALVDGDRIMAICTLDLKERGKLPHETVVGTVMTNLGFSKFCEENGLRFISTKVGDRYVLEEMLLGEYAIGGEQSGHIIFREFATTGDGQLTAVQLLSLLNKRGVPLSQLASVMKSYPQTMVNVTATADGKLRFYTDPEIKRSLDRATDEFGSRGRIVARPSGTEPLIRIMAEGEDPSEVARITDEVAAVIRGRLATYE